MPQKPGKVTVKDRGFIKRTLNQRALRGWQVTIGVHGTEAHRDDQIDNVALAVIHEFGTDDIPERSFLRSAFDKNQRTYERLLQLQAGRVIDGTQTPKGAVMTLGVKAVADVINGINRGIPPPLADSTVEAKGSTKQLIRTSQLKTSIVPKASKGR